MLTKMTFHYCMHFSANANLLDGACIQPQFCFNKPVGLACFFPGRFSRVSLRFIFHYSELGNTYKTNTLVNVINILKKIV